LTGGNFVLAFFPVVAINQIFPLSGCKNTLFLIMNDNFETGLLYTAIRCSLFAIRH
jgi:hypothetical protein